MSDVVGTMPVTEPEISRPIRPPSATDLLLRLAVEHFLFEEAAHFDNWRLDAWLALFTKEARYIVPATDRPDGDPRRDVMFIDDDFSRLQGRVNRLKSRHAHREYPYSRTRRLISNVRLTRVDDKEVDVEASFLVYRARAELIAPYVGLYRYTLARVGERDFRIKCRRAELDLERLSDHGAVSIIL
jgi:p-cumate 2,3-dioxygenase subunit beta